MSKILTNKQLLSAIPLMELNDFLNNKTIKLDQLFAYEYEAEGGTHYQLYYKNKYKCTLRQSKTGDCITTQKIVEVCRRVYPLLISTQKFTALSSVEIGKIHSIK